MVKPDISLRICFGLHFDEKTYISDHKNNSGLAFLGPEKLIRLLESLTGLPVFEGALAHLRVEEFRWAMEEEIKQSSSSPFYISSFLADPIATAAHILEMRDELAASGYRLVDENDTPERMKILYSLENRIRNKQGETFLYKGLADRVNAVIEKIKNHPIPIEYFWHYEPESMLPPLWQRLLLGLKEKGLEVKRYSSEFIQPESSDLSRVQQRLSGKETDNTPIHLKGDGSLLVLRARRDTDAASWISRIIKENPTVNPVFLVPEKKRILDNALVADGFPSMGVLSGTAARPSLQLLKLAPIFLWSPIDPSKIQEFTSLSLQPLHPKLASLITQLLNKTPGLHHKEWENKVGHFFEWLKNSKEQPAGKKNKYLEAQKEYAFWFERKSCEMGEPVPITAVIDLYTHIMDWASEKAIRSEETITTLLTLGKQCKQIIEVLEQLSVGRSDINALELEQLIRSIYESTPIAFAESTTGHFEYFEHEGSCPANVNHLCWWNFVRRPLNYAPSKWYEEEIVFLSKQGYQLENSGIQNQRSRWYSLQPLLQAQKKVFLIIPDFSDGKEVFPHTLHDNIQAICENLDTITFHIASGAENALPGLEKGLIVEAIPRVKDPEDDIHLRLDKEQGFENIEKSSPTGLIKMLYYPHQWFFKEIAKLRKTHLLHTLHESTQKGNIAHRFFEVFLKETRAGWTRETLFTFIDQISIRIFKEEGANYLLYGQEPDRISFLEKVKNAAWHFYRIMQENKWEIRDIETSIKGNFEGIAFNAIPDLVLKNGQDLIVIDFKWGGEQKRRNEIRNAADIQLALYSLFLQEGAANIHTYYYIIEKRVILGRNIELLTGSKGNAGQLDGDIHSDILRKISTTLDWRKKQFQDGLIELRTKKTAPLLDAFYGEVQLDQDILEMKNEDDIFDDYHGLLQQ